MTFVKTVTQTPRARVTTAAAAFAVAVTSLAGCASDDAPADNASSGAGASGPLLVGSDLTYPPYAYLEGDTPSGFDADIMNSLGEEMGREVEFADTRFEQLIASVNAGKFDVIASALYITAERAEQISYIPYFSTGSSILIRTGDAAVEDVEDLCGLRVAVIKGGVPSEELAEESENCVANGQDPIDARDFPTDPEGTQALLSGQVDAQVSDAAVAGEVAEKTDDQLEVSSTELLYPIPVGLAVKRGNDALKEQIEDALAELQASGAYEDLLQEYSLEPPDDAQVAQILGK